MDGLGEAPIDPLVLVLGASFALSLLGIPRLKAARSRAARESLRTRWIWFDWHHPFLARTLVSTLAVAVAAFLAREAWIWGPELWRHGVLTPLHGATAFISGR